MCQRSTRNYCTCAFGCCVHSAHAQASPAGICKLPTLYHCNIRDAPSKTENLQMYILSSQFVHLSVASWREHVACEPLCEGTNRVQTAENNLVNIWLQTRGAAINRRHQQSQCWCLSCLVAGEAKIKGKIILSIFHEESIFKHTFVVCITVGPWQTLEKLQQMSVWRGK